MTLQNLPNDPAPRIDREEPMEAKERMEIDPVALEAPNAENPDPRRAQFLKDIAEPRAVMSRILRHPPHFAVDLTESDDPNVA